MSLPASVALKLDRADEHVQALHVAHQKFLATNPYVARRVIEGGPREGEGTDHIFVWERYVEPPPCLGLIAGDAIHNARAALDHLAFALAQHGAAVGRQTMTEADETGIQFPITRSYGQFKYQLSKGRLKYVAADARTLIEARQPYRLSPADPDLSPLMRIANLDNTDKHRIIVPIAHAGSIMPIDWPAELSDTQAEFPAALPVGSQHGETGTEIFRFAFATPQREVDVPCEVRFACSFRFLPAVTIERHVMGWLSTVRAYVTQIAEQHLP